MRPLYQDICEATLDFNPTTSNTGLWYDKFCNQWRRNPEKNGPLDWSLESFKLPRQEPVNPKLDWMNTVCTTIGDKAILDETRTRYAALLESFGASPLFFNTTAPFATGLGREHPVENGFAWHHSLGVPYLPGSSVKGMVRAFVEYWADDKPSDEDIARIFGPRDKTGHAIGSVIFLDALPVGPVRLKPDVMTPHYSPYYQDSTGTIPPADWHSPIPIPFLVVDAGSTFQFGLLPRASRNREDCQKVAGWLGQALEWIGAGAKTAVGYGRMAPDDEALAGYQRSVKARKGPEETSWPNAKIRYEPGSRKLTATWEGQTAIRTEAKALFEESVKSKSRQDKAKSGNLIANVRVLVHPDEHIELAEILSP